MAMLTRRGRTKGGNYYHIRNLGQDCVHLLEEAELNMALRASLKAGRWNGQMCLWW